MTILGDEIPNPKQLRARYPYMFAGENIGFSFSRGWFALFSKLCHDIDQLLGENKRGFRWVQLKEKLGSARFYWEMEGYGQRLFHEVRPENSLVSQIAALVRETTAETRSSCIVCGQPGWLDQSQPHVLVLCEHHKQQRVQGVLDPWFSDEEAQ